MVGASCVTVAGGGLGWGGGGGGCARVVLKFRSQSSSAFPSCAVCAEVTLRLHVPHHLLPADQCAEHGPQEYGPAAGKGHIAQPADWAHTDARCDQPNPISACMRVRAYSVETNWRAPTYSPLRRGCFTLCVLARISPKGFIGWSQRRYTDAERDSPTQQRRHTHTHTRGSCTQS